MCRVIPLRCDFVASSASSWATTGGGTRIAPERGWTHVAHLPREARARRVGARAADGSPARHTDTHATRHTTSCSSSLSFGHCRFLDTCCKGSGVWGRAAKEGWGVTLSCLAACAVSGGAGRIWASVGYILSGSSRIWPILPRILSKAPILG